MDAPSPPSPLPPPLAPPALPARIGPYEILGVVSRGGSSVVYRAMDPKLGREVALKRLREELWSRAEDHARFLREASFLAELSHPGIVPVHDAGVADGVPYYTMDLVEGEPLTRHLAARKAPLDERLRIFLLVCDAAHHAHLRGIVHRDLKPSNILVRSDGRPVILDFGIARPANPDAEPLTVAGYTLGTPRYMSPESARGDALRIDLRTDVYSLGVVLYELVCGRVPFPGEEPLSVLKAIVEEPPPRPSRLAPEIPRDLERVILKAIEKDPDRRYFTAFDLASDVRRLLEGRPVAAHPDSPLYRLGKWIRRRRELAAIYAAALLAILGIAAWSYLRIYRAAQDARMERDRALAAERRALDSLRRYEEEKERRERGIRAEAILAGAAHLKGAEALPLLSEALSLVPDHPQALLSRARIFLQDGNAGGALADLEKALAAEPGFVLAHDLRGRVLQLAGRLGEAAKSYRAALRCDPAFEPAAETLLGMARKFAVEGSPKEAAEIFEMLLSASTDPALAARAWQGLGEARIRLADPDGARKALLESLALEPHSPAAHFLLGKAFEALEDPAKAEPHYDEALATSRDGDPFRDECRQRLESIRARMGPRDR